MTYLNKYQFIFFSFGVMIGTFSWGNGVYLTPISLLLFLGYLRIGNRLLIGVLSFGYYLGASRGLYLGLYTYYDSISIASCIWILVSFINSLAWWTLWSKHRVARYYLFPFVLVVIILPPFGFINWTNPLISAGVLFPSSKWFGLIFILFIVYGIDFLSMKKFFIGLVAIPVSLIMIALSSNSSNPSMKYSFASINTSLGKSTNISMKKFERNKLLLKKVNKSKEKYLILPENSLTYFNESDMFIWSELEKDKVVYAGTYTHTSSKKYDNVLIKIHNNKFEILYKQRVPVPMSMWKPWSVEGANAYPYSNPTIESENGRMGVFICYEQLLTFTYIQTMLDKPIIILGLSNLWWAKNTSIKNIQVETLQLWSLLFNIPFYFSINR